MTQTNYTIFLEIFACHAHALKVHSHQYQVKQKEKFNEMDETFRLFMIGYDREQKREEMPKTSCIKLSTNVEEQKHVLETPELAQTTKAEAIAEPTKNIETDTEPTKQHVKVSPQVVSDNDWIIV